ncbi:uncharacterized protein LAESUDRAFT_761699 [Laetiporus sulphureus 93-53]|uniref:Uncharacterized protein n=1 Tax=Laetiporus sulphureus 93-53 TaxID=1314785 RepID=A0A165D072_9APHY|nr:uncharacterized protein LAESUDRAFT_761699 [Laetiporus sulphureus 93-53]KZT03872.1 hypothetical protein LAESUDRAFT_761699 [Laetiporus sulphureus 93-53]
MAATPSDVEMMLVHAIEWTSFMESTYTFALEGTIAILCYLLAGQEAPHQLPWDTIR